MPHSLVGRLSDFRYPTPVIKRARVRDASALDILEPPDGDDLRSGQRPQPVEVSEWTDRRVRLCGHIIL